MGDKKYTLGGGSQIHKRDSTSLIMWSVSLALLPAGLWGLHIFGLRSLLVLVASIVAACLGELIINLFTKKITLGDGSAFLTGFLIGLNMPPSVPFYIPAIASLFAILVVKWSFGGLGCNWMNPALAGRVFVFFSWSDKMAHWTYPLEKGHRFFERLFINGKIDFTGIVQADTVSSVTPLAPLKTAGEWLTHNSVATPLELFNQTTHPLTYKDLFMGTIPGCIGEVSVLLLLIGAVFLLIRKIIRWEIPVAFLGSFALLIWIFGGRGLSGNFFTGDVVFHLFSGGLILGAFFMATDMVTSPVTSKGMIIFGVGCGFLTYLFRAFNSFPEGVSFAILLMNIVVPLIDKYITPKRYGMVKEVKTK